MWQALLTGVSLGLFAAVQPGVFQAFLLGETMRRGFLATAPLVVAPLVSDGPIALITVLVLSQTPPWLIASIELLGGAFVLWLAVDAAGQLRRPAAGSRTHLPQEGGSEDHALTGNAALGAEASRATSHAANHAADHAAQSHLPSGFASRFTRAVLINGLNPGPWLFWTLVLGPVVVAAWRRGPLVGAVAIGSFYATLISGFLLMVVLFGLASRRGAAVRRGLQIVSVVALAVFGVLLIWHGGTRLL